MLTLLLLLPAAAPPVAPVVPLANAHAHNDYEHKRPLFDALDHGFTSVEADVYLVNGKLLVGHLPWELRKERTLESLYLEPLKKRVEENKGDVYPPPGKKPAPPFFLLVDVKTDAEKTYAALDKVLQRYETMLTVCRDGKVTRRAITVVVSGNCAREVIKAQKVRYAAIDGRPADLDSDAPADLVPFVSASWYSQLKWNGQGPMPDAERNKLKEMVGKAHRHGRRVRFWATAEREAVWQKLLDAGVDLINTDKLPELRRFLLAALSACLSEPVRAAPVSARAKGWTYVALFLLALGGGVAVFLATTSADTRPAALLAVAGLITFVGAIYACIEAVRYVRKVFSPSPQSEPELLAPERASFRPEYTARFGQRPRGEPEQPQRRPTAGGQDGIESSEV